MLRLQTSTVLAKNFFKRCSNLHIFSCGNMRRLYLRVLYICAIALVRVCACVSCCPCLCVIAHVLPCNAHKHAKKVYGSDPAAAEGSIRVQPPTPLRFLHPRSLSLSLSLSHTHTHKHSENVQPPDLSFSISLTNSVPLSILLSSRSGSQARIPHTQLFNTFACASCRLHA